eukprot:SAG11_NODE_10233_length_845_cov_1.037534_1_plen_53_part_10
MQDGRTVLIGSRHQALDFSAAHEAAILVHDLFDLVHEIIDLCVERERKAVHSA